MINIPYDDESIYYAGRWDLSNSSARSYWQGSQIRFRVEGTGQIILDLSVTGSNFVVVNIDSGPAVLYTLSTTSNQSLVIPLPNASMHTIVLKLFSDPVTQFSGTSTCALRSIQLDNEGALSPWGNRGLVVVQAVGDSWMAAQNDWPYLLNNSVYNIQPIAFGGAKTSDLNSQYNNFSSSTVAVADKPANLVLVSTGVNDTYANVSVSDYQTAMSALVDKIRIRQPNARIGILGAPRNIAANRLYNQYDSANQAVANSKTGVTFTPTPNSVADNLSWDTDQAHLTFTGRQQYAAWVKTQIDPIIDFRSISVTTSQGSTPVLLGLGSQEGDLSVRLNGGLYRTKLEPVYTPYPEQKVLVKLLNGIFQISE